MAGFRVWNYNKSADDTVRGASSMHASIDGRTASPPAGFAIRKARLDAFRWLA